MKPKKDELDDVLEEGQGDASQTNVNDENMEQDTLKDCPQETWHW